MEWPLSPPPRRRRHRHHHHQTHHHDYGHHHHHHFCAVRNFGQFMPSCGPICPAVSSQKPFTSDRYIEYIEYRERELCMCAFVRASTNDMPYSFNVPDYLGCISEPILNQQCLLVSKAPVMHEYKKLKAYFQQNVIIEHINMLTD